VGDWDRTHDVDVSGGAFFGKPQERKFDDIGQHWEAFGKNSGKRESKNRMIRVESLKTRRRKEGRVPAIY